MNWVDAFRSVNRYVRGFPDAKVPAKGKGKKTPAGAADKASRKGGAAAGHDCHG